MIKQTLSFSIAIVFLSLTVFAGIIKEGSLRASSDGNAITIQWFSEDESGVARYELERKNGVNGAFMPLAVVSTRGNSSSYQFVDETAFRISESIYKYQVKVLFSNGAAPAYYGPITVIHKTNDVRRTWGSIKAMFR